MNKEKILKTFTDTISHSKPEDGFKWLIENNEVSTEEKVQVIMMIFEMMSEIVDEEEIYAE